MYKRAISLLLCISLIFTMGLCLCACNGDKSNEYPVTVGDVTIDKEPLNIVVLSSSMADIISYMGYDVKMVGRDIDSNQSFLSVVPIVGSALDPNVNSIISYEADLVIAEDSLSDNVKTSLLEAQIPVVTFSKATNLNELEELYVNIGTVLGGNITGAAQGQSSYDELITTLSDFEDAIPSDIVKTSCYLYLDDTGALCTFTKGSIEYELFSYCGAINVFSTQETPQVDLQQLKISTPSFIFYDDEAVLEYLNNDADLSTMGALTQGKTYQVDKMYFDRQGTTAEELIYHMIDFMFVQSEATVDESTAVDDTEAETVAGFSF